MMQRRAFLSAFAAVVYGNSLYSRAALADQNADDTFQKLLDDTIGQNIDAIETATADREGLTTALEYLATRPLVGRPKRSSRTVSEQATQLIVRFEVTSPSHYQAKLQPPTWPGGASGPTIGVGYDIGYVHQDWLSRDWSGYISEDDIRTLSSGCGVTGSAARDLTPELSGVRIPWDVANRQFREVVLPMYITETMQALPNSEALSDDSLGALVSLVYNRGPSFQLLSSRYAEMRQIRLDMVTSDLQDIPLQLANMKKLWGKDLSGLWVRRDLEAKLFRIGIA